ncbi:MAG: periplasmic heavy metal sensor [Alphaproteobacteria bacterium]
MLKQSKIITVLGTALFLSLSANLFMGGKMLGQSYHHGGDKGGWEQRREEWKKRDMALREKLNEADRAIVKEHMEGQRERFKAMRETLDAAEDKVDAAKAADPFDRAALETALREQAEKKAALIGTMRETRAAMLEKLSPEGREIMKKNGPRFHGKEGRDGRDGWRGRDRDGDRERGGRFFERRGEGPRGEGYGESGRPPRPDGPPPMDGPPPADAPPPPADAPPPPEDAPPAP